MLIRVGDLVRDLKKFPADLPVLVGHPDGAMSELAMISMVRAVKEGSEYVPTLGENEEKFDVVVTLSKGER